MEKNKLIVKQQLQIQALKKKLKSNKKNVKTIKGNFTAIGQPLNDNLLKFNSEQLQWAKKVYQYIDLLY